MEDVGESCVKMTMQLEREEHAIRANEGKQSGSIWTGTKGKAETLRRTV
jgi:hypothetical protein